MGLDSVELVMGFEEEFGLQIADEAAENMLTPRDVIDYVFAQLNGRDRTECATRDAFFEVRDALPVVVGGYSGRVRPSTTIREVLPWEQRQRFWDRLQKQDSVQRALQRSRNLTRFLRAGVVIGGVVIGVASGSWIIGIVSALVLSVVGFSATAPLALEFPAECVITLGDVARLVAEGRVGRNPPREGWERAEIAQRVRRIITGQLGIKEFDDGDRFVDDLGVV